MILKWIFDRIVAFVGLMFLYSVLLSYHLPNSMRERCKSFKMPRGQVSGIRNRHSCDFSFFINSIKELPATGWTNSREMKKNLVDKVTQIAQITQKRETNTD